MRSSPPLNLELPPVGAWLTRLWELWSLVLALTVALAGELPGWERVACLGALVPAAWLGRRWFGRSSADSVCRLGWAARDGWWLMTLAGHRHYVQPVSAAQSLGPWLLLVFRDGHRRYFVVLDRWRAEPGACAALQTLLALQTPRWQG